MDLISTLNLFLRISIISTVSTLLNKGNINSIDFIINNIITTIGWLFIITLHSKNKKLIDKIDKKIGYPVTTGIVGPIIILIIRIIVDPICFLKYDKIILTFYTILGFTIFNVFFRNRILYLKIDKNLKEIIETIIKPAIIVTTNECYTGLNTDSFFKVISVITGFMTHLFIKKTLNL